MSRGVLALCLAEKERDAYDKGHRQKEFMLCDIIRHRSVYNPSWDNLTWWRHQMDAFSALLAICAGNSPVPGEFPAQRPMTRNFDVFFDLRPNKWLSKQWWSWWFEMPSNPLWRHCNELGCASLLIHLIWKFFIDINDIVVILLMQTWVLCSNQP